MADFAPRSIDTRHSLTYHLLGGAGVLSRLAFEIETRPESELTNDDRVGYVGYVIGAITESVSALETETWEILHHGPGNHLGSGGFDQQARDFLRPLAELIDGQDVLSRFATILHLLNRPPLCRGRQPWQDAGLLVRLRNEIVHYKSRWGAEYERKNLMAALEKQRLPKAPFYSAGLEFFPHRPQRVKSSLGGRHCRSRNRRLLFARQHTFAS